VPHAISLKKTCKKYAGVHRGEVMLVHVCEECDKISINRIAADDDSGTLLEVFAVSRSLDTRTKPLIALDEITILEPGEHHMLQVQLFGRS
jgi:hypothetical protein